ncbi:hypothetical protein B0H19DRAFT_246073 [Mycena capillaripes]|nr:hypothetical protein B0H19DRAFT_246073 [Mycena capillaripes]
MRRKHILVWMTPGPRHPLEHMVIWSHDFSLGKRSILEDTSSAGSLSDYHLYLSLIGYPISHIRSGSHGSWYIFWPSNYFLC